MQNIKIKKKSDYLSVLVSSLVFLIIYNQLYYSHQIQIILSYTFNFNYDNINLYNILHRKIDIGHDYVVFTENLYLIL